MAPIGSSELTSRHTSQAYSPICLHLPNTKCSAGVTRIYPVEESYRKPLFMMRRTRFRKSLKIGQFNGWKNDPNLCLRIVGSPTMIEGASGMLAHLAGIFSTCPGFVRRGCFVEEEARDAESKGRRKWLLQCR